VSKLHFLAVSLKPIEIDVGAIGTMTDRDPDICVTGVPEGPI
jgi:hypothetical protein